MAVNLPIDYSFQIFDTSGIAGYKVFAKINDFTGNNVPDDRYLIHNLPPSVTYGQFLPPTSGNWFLRVYSYNAYNDTYSTNFASLSHDVIKRPDIENVVIKNLNFETNERFNYVGADFVTKTGSYLGSSVSFKWDTDLADNSSILPSGAKYRLTIREPSFTDIPTTTIYHEDRTLNIDTDNEIIFDFNINKNILLTGGPYRNYDFVVEAIDTLGCTSSKNTTNPIAETWANKDGYKMLYATNSAYTGFYLTANNNPSGYFKTVQNITPENYINITVTSGTIYPDIIGAFIYSCTGIFTTGDLITGGFQSGLNIVISDYEYKKDYKFQSYNSDFNIVNSGYLAISLYDFFDNDLKTYRNIRTGLWISNIVPIVSSGSIGFLNITNAYVNSISISSGNNSYIGMTTLTGSGLVLVNNSNFNSSNSVLTVNRITPSGIIGNLYYSFVDNISFTIKSTTVENSTVAWELTKIT